MEFNAGAWLVNWPIQTLTIYLYDWLGLTEPVYHIQHSGDYMQNTGHDQPLPSFFPHSHRQVPNNWGLLLDPGKNSNNRRHEWVSLCPRQVWGISSKQPKPSFKTFRDVWLMSVNTTLFPFIYPFLNKNGWFPKSLQKMKFPLSFTLWHKHYTPPGPLCPNLRNMVLVKKRWKIKLPSSRTWWSITPSLSIWLMSQSDFLERRVPTF